MAKVRKEVHLPEDIIKDLKLVAFSSDKTVKKWMEDLIVNRVREDAKRLKK